MNSSRHAGPAPGQQAMPGMLALVAEPEPKHCKGQPAKAPKPAGQVVAAFAEARQAAGLLPPTKAECGQVGREAKALLAAGLCGLDELLTAADSLGRTRYAGLRRQVDMLREQHRPVQQVGGQDGVTWITEQPRWVV